ncbi:hypothetical protein CR513_41192, partial [Mucuna pruriens]
MAKNRKKKFTFLSFYYLQRIKIGNNTNNEDLPSSQRATSETWTTSQIWVHHKRLRHPPFSLLKTMFLHLFTKEYDKSFNCDVCLFSKHHHATSSPNLSIFIEFFRLVKNQFGKSIKRLWLDNGTKFINVEFSKFLKDNDVAHKLTCANTPQQNGVAKRKNHHLLEVPRTLLFLMSIGKKP